MRKRTRVLLTGAAGKIGSAIRPYLRAEYDKVRLLDIQSVPEPQDGEEVVIADICSLDAMRRATTGVDAVVHLAGIPDEDSWPIIRDVNIDGTFNTMEAARVCGAKRVIFASSHHVIAFREIGTPVGIDVPLHPTGLYGVSKAFGETLGRLYSLKFGVSVICLRISAFQPQPRDHRQLLIWISPRDMAQLVIRSIDVGEKVRFLTVFGVSGNDRNPYDRTGWDVLGYVPLDNSERFLGTSPNLRGEPVLPSDFYYGGDLCVPGDQTPGNPPRVPARTRAGQ